MKRVAATGRVCPDCGVNRCAQNVARTPTRARCWPCLWTYLRNGELQR